jgi:hypothetical protein
MNRKKLTVFECRNLIKHELTEVENSTRWDMQKGATIVSLVQVDTPKISCTTDNDEDHERVIATLPPGYMWGSKLKQIEEVTDMHISYIYTNCAGKVEILWVRDAQKLKPEWKAHPCTNCGKRRKLEFVCLFGMDDAQEPRAKKRELCKKCTKPRYKCRHQICIWNYRHWL